MLGSQLSHSLAFAMNFRLLPPKHAARCSCFQPHQDRSWPNSQMKSGARNSKSDRNIFFSISLHVIFFFFGFSPHASLLLPIFSFFYLYFLSLPQFLFFTFFSPLLLTFICTFLIFHLTKSNHCKIAINL